jgi:hypothetical protein
MNFDKLPECEDAPKPAVSPRNLRLGLWAVLLLVVTAAGWWVYQQRKTDTGRALSAERTAQVREKELRLTELAADLARPANDATTRLRLAEQGLATIQEIMRLRPRAEPKDAQRLFEWQARRDEARAAQLSVESKRREEESEGLMRKGDREGAIARLKEAWSLQREINSSAASQVYKNYGRETRLAGEAERLEAEPLGQAVAGAQAEAEQAVAAGRWGEALAAYHRAKEALEQLNRDYPRSRYADIEGLARLDKEISALAAVEPVEQRDRAVALAKAPGAGRMEALRHFREALEWQRKINTEHAQSRFASEETSAGLEQEIQTLEAAGAWAELAEADWRIAAHLGRRELFQAQELITPAARQMEQAAARWPKAAGAPEELKLRLTFLALRVSDLAVVQDQVHDSLRPLPAPAARLMSRRETWQGLFSAVMNFNPSKTPGRDNAVDSVTHEEAEEFCRRLGWMMGRRVSLPAEEDYLAAGRAGAAGWRNLTDGFAEWAGGAADEKGQRAVFSVEAAGAMARRAGGERSRGVGFRFVVEAAPAGPAK